MIWGLVLIGIDRLLKSGVSSQLTATVLVQPVVLVLVFVAFAVLWVGARARIIPLPAVGLVTFGALSNLIDAVMYRGVVDYLPFFGFQTNVADLMIGAGCLYIAWTLLRH